MSELLDEEEIAFWREFYRRWPFDDLHRYHRPAALICSAGAAKGMGETAFSNALEVLSPKPKKPARRLRAARVIRNPKE